MEGNSFEAWKNWNWRACERDNRSLWPIYLYEPRHPMASDLGWVRLDRWLKALEIGRFLTDADVIDSQTGDVVPRGTPGRRKTRSTPSKITAPDDVLAELVDRAPLSSVCKLFGVSDVTLRNHCVDRGIAFHEGRYWQREQRRVNEERRREELGLPPGAPLPKKSHHKESAAKTPPPSLKR